MGRSEREREADALVRLYRPTWTDMDPSTGKRLQRTSPTWWADYHEDGKRVRKSLGTPYRQDAELARGKILRRLRERAAGIEDPFTAHRERPIAHHVSDFKVTLEARGVTAAHAE